MTHCTWTCGCERCTSHRAQHVTSMRAFRASLPDPVYDWADLEAQDRRSRETPAWYREAR